ncbi:alpha/beta-Hydrolases superfamily protein [Striga asiatica]|uniref:Alpha/beta-Hydrolases superfamily protein n=1 Tax=Striga asiatica TaxID=4170 RepID=A0A5A7QCD5_STRAF|nr:alpha/beta-Hydrolases superfamily protein [Striga asiatica]
MIAEVGIAIRCFSRAVTKPKCSDISKSQADIPFGSSQSKQCINCATINFTTVSPSCSPGQLLRPDPNGNSSKSCPLKSISLPINLSGENFSGSGQTSGSLPIAHTLTNNLDCFGMWKPSIVQSCVDSWGINNGATGWSLWASLITESK